MVTLQKKPPLLLCNNSHETLTMLQPRVRICGAAQSSTDLVSTFRRLNIYQIIPELNVKWHLRSVLKDGSIIKSSPVIFNYLGMISWLFLTIYFDYNLC